MNATSKCSDNRGFQEMSRGHQEGQLINILEKISAVALGAFSFYTNLQLFVPFFLVGVSIGIYSHMNNEESCSGHNPISSCAHGLLEQLTGVKLPRIISLIANIAVTICHIDHHDSVFVPVVGVSLGNWIGKTVGGYAAFACTKITANSSILHGSCGHC